MIYPNWHYTSPSLASSITIQMGWASEQIPTRWMMWGWSNCCMITAIRAGCQCSHAFTWLHYKTDQHMATMNLILVFGINLRQSLCKFSVYLRNRFGKSHQPVFGIYQMKSLIAISDPPPYFCIKNQSTILLILKLFCKNHTHP